MLYMTRDLYVVQVKSAIFTPILQVIFKPTACIHIWTYFRQRNKEIFIIPGQPEKDSKIGQQVPNNKTYWPKYCVNNRPDTVSPIRSQHHHHTQKTPPQYLKKKKKIIARTIPFSPMRHIATSYVVFYYYYIILSVSVCVSFPRRNCVYVQPLLNLNLHIVNDRSF